MTNVMDLSLLYHALKDRGLPYRIGAITPGDGNCYYTAVRQNILHCVTNGSWPKDVHVPTVDELREMAINYLVTNKAKYVGQRIEDNRTVHGILSEEQFQNLIASQSKLDVYTDQDGLMVEAVAKVLDVEVTLVITNIGPLQVINSSEDPAKQLLKFSVGLIRLENNDNDDAVGHYQFIYYHPDGERDRFIMPTEHFPPPIRNRGNKFNIFIFY